MNVLCGGYKDHLSSNALKLFLNGANEILEEFFMRNKALWIVTWVLEVQFTTCDVLVTDIKERSKEDYSVRAIFSGNSQEVKESLVLQGTLKSEGPSCDQHLDHFAIVAFFVHLLKLLIGNSSSWNSLNCGLIDCRHIHLRLSRIVSTLCDYDLAFIERVWGYFTQLKLDLGESTPVLLTEVNDPYVWFVKLGVLNVHVDYAAHKSLCVLYRQSEVIKLISSKLLLEYRLDDIEMLLETCHSTSRSQVKDVKGVNFMLNLYCNLTSLIIQSRYLCDLIVQDNALVASWLPRDE